LNLLPDFEMTSIGVQKRKVEDVSKPGLQRFIDPKISQKQDVRNYILRANYNPGRTGADPEPNSDLLHICN
jgi:hypothetical protein